MQKQDLDWGSASRPGGPAGRGNGTIPTRQWLYWMWKDNAHTGPNWCKNGNANGSYVQQIEYEDCLAGTSGSRARRPSARSARAMSP